MKPLFIFTLITITFACAPSKKVISNKKEAKETLILGKWKVVQANITPYEHISFCEKLGLGAIFEFQKDSVLNVYPKKGEKMCNRSQVYRIWQGDIQITEIDMVFLYDIEMLTTDTLKIKMNHVPHYFNTMNHPKGINIEELKKEGVKLTLIKQ